MLHYGHHAVEKNCSAACVFNSIFERHAGGGIFLGQISDNRASGASAVWAYTYATAGIDAKDTIKPGCASIATAGQ